MPLIYNVNNLLQLLVDLQCIYTGCRQLGFTDAILKKNIFNLIMIKGLGIFQLFFQEGHSIKRICSLAESPKFLLFNSF